MLLARIFGMASPPRRLACAIGAEIADHLYATSSGIPGVLPPWRVVVLVATESTPCAGAVQGRCRREAARPRHRRPLPSRRVSPHPLALGDRAKTVSQGVQMCRKCA